MRAPGEKPVPARGDGARRHDDDLAPLVEQAHDLRHERRHHGRVQPVGACRQQVRAELRNDSAVARPRVVSCARSLHVISP